MDIYLPNREVILALHDVVLQTSGGRPGVLHPHMIEGALQRPQTYMQYSECDLHTVCALVLDSIARHHVFNDGNKRTALMATLFTYKVNSVFLEFGLFMNQDYEELVLWVATQKPPISEITERLKILTEKYQKTGIDKMIQILKTAIGVE